MPFTNVHSWWTPFQHPLDGAEASSMDRLSCLIRQCAIREAVFLQICWGKPRGALLRFYCWDKLRDLCLPRSKLFIRWSAAPLCAASRQPAHRRTREPACRHRIFLPASALQHRWKNIFYINVSENFFPYTFALVLTLLIKKGGGNWPHETLATVAPAKRCYIHPAKAGEISQMPLYFVFIQNITEHFWIIGSAFLFRIDRKQSTLVNFDRWLHSITHNSKKMKKTTTSLFKTTVSNRSTKAAACCCCCCTPSCCCTL